MSRLFNGLVGFKDRLHPFPKFFNRVAVSIIAAPR
jgi:hypothetical protein